MALVMVGLWVGLLFILVKIGVLKKWAYVDEGVANRRSYCGSMHSGRSYELGGSSWPCDGISVCHQN